MIGRISGLRPLPIRYLARARKAFRGHHMNALSEALPSGSILLREGLEALLVIAALAAFLTRAGVPEKVRSLYVGAGLAILASLGAAVVFELYFDGGHNDFIEAGVMVVAAVL